MSRDVLIVPTGTANTASVRAAMDRLGVASRIASDVDELATAGAVVLPGVGAFGAAMERIRAASLEDVLRARIERGGATLCICLGMQLLFEASDESPGVRGLGVVEGTVRSLPAGVRRPQMGWNEVVPVGDGAFEQGVAYFANSFCVCAAAGGWEAAWTTHGTRFVSAMRRGAVVACQFHPELSGAYGERLMARWLAEALSRSEEAAPC